MTGDIYKGDVKAIGKDLLSMAPFGVYKIGGKLAAQAPKTSQAVYKGTKYGNKGAKISGIKRNIPTLLTITGTKINRIFMSVNWKEYTYTPYSEETKAHKK